MLSEPTPTLDILDPPAAVLPGRDMYRLEALGEMVICSSVPTQLAIGWLLRLAGWAPTDDAGQLSLGFIAAMSLADTAVLVALMTALIRSRGESPASLWLGTRRVLGEAVAGLLHVPAIFLLIIALLGAMRLLAPQLHNVETNPFETLAGNGVADAAVLALVAIVAGGVREELQRAFLLDRFQRGLGPAWVGVIVLSAAFGLGHLLQGRDAAVATGAMGAFWALVYLRRRSSVAPVVSHAAFNSLEILRLVAIGR